MESKNLACHITLCTTRRELSTTETPSNERTGMRMGNCEDPIATSCSAAIPTRLVTWKLGQTDSGLTDTNHELKAPETISQGLVMACEDGSLFLFRSPPIPSTPTEVASGMDPNPSISIEEALVSRFPPSSGSSSPTPARDYPPPLPPKPYAPEIRSRAASIKSSRSGNLPSLSLSTGGGYHGQATAGLSNEQASAPRNYVDFDPESAKLKEMLKTKGPTREAGIVDGFMPLFGRKSIEVDKEREWRLRNETMKPKKKEKRLSSLSMSGITQDERSGRASPLSAMFTSYSTPHSATPKSSPENPDGQRVAENRLRLIAHYLPKRVVLSHRVVALETLEGNKACLSLQESG
jgi:hypothetical protein